MDLNINADDVSICIYRAVYKKAEGYPGEGGVVGSVGFWDVVSANSFG